MWCSTPLLSNLPVSVCRAALRLARPRAGRRAGCGHGCGLPLQIAEAANVPSVHKQRQRTLLLKSHRSRKSQRKSIEKNQKTRSERATRARRREIPRTGTGYRYCRSYRRGHTSHRTAAAGRGVALLRWWCCCCARPRRAWGVARERGDVGSMLDLARQPP